MSEPQNEEQNEQNGTSHSENLDTLSQNAVEKEVPEKPTRPSPRKKKKPAAKLGNKKPVNTKPEVRRSPRSFPAVTLEEALRIPTVIKVNNGGNSWSPEEVAQAVGWSAKRTEFFYLAGGSAAYGLTSGGWKAPKIELTALGREIVYPGDPMTERTKKLEAFLSIEVFAKVLQYYKGSDLPEMRYLGNTLERNFSIPREQHEDFSRIFRANCDYLGVEKGYSSEQPSGSTALNGAGIKPPSPPSPSSITLAEPEQGSTLTAFVIMPFVERDLLHSQGFFSEVLKSLITPAAREAGFIVKTANRHGSDVIQSTIINDLLAADLVIADLTEHNPNVLFELGVRMADDLPVCLIKATGTGQIFDVDNMLRVYPYSSNLWASTIEKDLPNLTDHIRGAWETRNNENTYMKILKRGVVATSSNNYDASPASSRN
jgi:hypothetical protein